VDDRIDGPVAEYLTDRADVGFVEVDTWRQRVCVAGRQIVHHDHVVAGRQ